MQTAYVELSNDEKLRLVRKRKRMNLLVLSGLLLFVGLTYAGSLFHISKENGAAASVPAAPASITQN